MRRSRESLDEVASLENLRHAFALAALGKSHRPEVIDFRRDLDRHLGHLSGELWSGGYQPSPLKEFTIHDPKTRRIKAPVFRDRVVHHALMSRIGPVLDRSLVSDSFACRIGKGTHAAVDRAQRHLRRLPWYAKMDVKSYFQSIDHDRLLRQLQRRLKDPGVLALCASILSAYGDAPGRGLPIGALTSQHFANLYLGPLDRMLLEDLKVGGFARFMDDVILWGHSREFCRAAVEVAARFAEAELGLRLHRVQIQRSARGVTYLGFRLDGTSRRPSLRRRRRYRRARARWERAFAMGLIDAPTLQRGYSAALAILHGCRSEGLRRGDLDMHQPVDA